LLADEAADVVAVDDEVLLVVADADAADGGGCWCRLLIRAPPEGAAKIRAGAYGWLEVRGGGGVVAVDPKGPACPWDGGA